MATNVAFKTVFHLCRTLFLVSMGLALVGFLALPVLAQTSTWSGGAGNWSPCPNQSGTAKWDTCNNATPEFPDSSTANAVINGGPVTATSALIANLTINSGDMLVFPPGQATILDILGPNIVNNGSISLAGVDGLQIEGNGTVTLSGTGSVTMAGNNFTGGNGKPTLILQQPVHGQGTFSLGFDLKNQSVITASGGTLFMQPNSVVNTGTMQAGSGGTLTFPNGVQTAYNNTGGTIQALNGGTVNLENGIYTGGTLATVGTGLITASGAAVINALTNSGTFQVLTSNTGTLENTINNIGTIEVPSATLFMSGNVTLSGAGSLILSSGTLHPSGSSDTLTNQQLQLIHGSGTIFHLGLTNNGTISADSPGNTLSFAGGSNTNNSTIQASGGGILQVNNDNTVNNSRGVIAALSGSTVIIQGVIGGGTLTTAGTGVIESQNGTLDGTVNVPTNRGTLNVNSFDLFFQGNIANTGTISLTGNSCIILNKPSTLTGSGHVNMASTSCIFGSGLSFTNNSTIQGAGSIGDSNPMPIFNGGTIFANQKSPLQIVPDSSGFTNTGKLMVKGGSTLNIHAPFNTISSIGTLMGGSYLVNGLLEFPNSITTNSANIALTGVGAEILNPNTSTNALATLAANSITGVLLVQGGQSLSTGTSLTNAGKITVGTGSSLTVHGSYTQTAGFTTLDGTLTATSGLTIQKGSLMGRGTLAAVVTSSATVTAGDSVSKAGKLTVTGTYTQKSTGLLNVAIGGTTVGTQYSQVAVSNGAMLDGTLQVKRINGFVPTVGETFKVLTGSAVSGKFAIVAGLSINSTEHFEITYAGTAVTLTVVSGS